MPNFIEINRAVTTPRAKRYRLMVIRATSSQCMLAWIIGEAQLVVRCKNITILGWHYSDTNSPYNPKISRSVASYIAARRNLTINFHCYKLPRYVPAKLASWPCRPWMALKLESSLSRPLKLKRALLQKYPPDLYYIFTTSKQTCRWCTG